MSSSVPTPAPAPAQGPPGRRRGWPWRLLLLGILLATFLGLALSRSSVLGPALVRVSSERLERWTGCQVAVERVSGSWYDGLVLEGLELIGRREGSPIRYLRGEARARYSLWGLLRGQDGALEVLDIDAEDLVLDLAGGNGAGAGPTPPLALPRGRWQVKAGEIRLPGQRELLLEELLLELDEPRPARGEQRPEGQRTSIDVAELSLGGEQGALWRGAAALRGTYRAGLLEIATLDLDSSIDGTSGGVRRGRLDLRGLPEHEYAFRFPLDTLGGVIEVDARVRDRSWKLRAGARKLDLVPLAPLASRLVPGDWIHSWPDGQVEGYLTLEFELPTRGEPGRCPSGELRFQLRDGWVLGYPADSLQALATFGEQGLTVQEAHLLGPVAEAWLQAPAEFVSPSPITVAPGRWPVPSIPADISVDVPFEGSLFDLPAFGAGPIGQRYRLLELLPDELEPLTGCASFQAHWGGRWNAARFDMDLEGHDLATEDLPWGAARVALHAEPGRVALPHVSIDGPLLDAAGGLELPAPGDGWLCLAGRVLDLGLMSRVIERWGPQVQLEGEGAFDLDWHRRTSLHHGHLDLSLRGEDISWGELLLRELDGRVTGDHLDLHVEEASVLLDRVEDGASLLPHGALLARAPTSADLSLHRDELGHWSFEGEGLRLEPTGLPELGLELQGTAALRVDFARGELDCSPAELAVLRGAGNEEEPVETGRLSLSGRRTPGGLEALVGFEGFDSTPWLTTFLPPELELGTLDGGFSLGLRGDGSGQQIHEHLLADLELSGLQWSDELPAETRAWLRVEQTGQDVTLERFQVEAPELGSLLFSGRTRLDADAPGLGLANSPGRFALEAELERPEPLLAWIPEERLPEDFATVGQLRLEGEVTGDGESLRGSLELSGENLYASGFVEDERPIFGPAELSARLRLEEQGLDIEHLMFSSRELDLQAEALLMGAVPQDPRRLAEYLRTAPGDESGSLQVEDLEWLAPWLPGVRRSGGSLVAALPPRQDRRPEAPWGRVFLTDGLMRFRGSELFVQDLAGELRVQEGLLQLQQLKGEFGASEVTVSGELDLRQPTARLDLGLSARDLLLARSRGLRIRADAVGEDGGGEPELAGLRIRGPLDQLEVSGRVALRGSRFTRQYDLLGWLSRREQGAPERNDGIRLVLAEDGPLANMRLDVEVASTEPFRISNNLVESSMRPQLRLLGTGKLAFLQGPVYVDPSRLNLPSGQLEVTGGTVIFSEQDPFFPRLDLTAQQRIRGFDITVSVSGTTRVPEVTITSNPPLPGDEALVLLITGQIPEGSWGDKTSRAGQVLAIYLAKDALMRAFGGDDGGESAMDRLELTLGQDVSRQGVETMRVSVRLDERPEGTGVTNYLTAERDEFDKENFGYRILWRFR